MSDPENRLDRIVAQTVRARQQREQGYRERALKLLPWICGRCGREFDRRNLHQLTVHHRDHDHDNNPADGSNWELLCFYCHDNEHSRTPENVERAVRSNDVEPATHKPFADLQQRLKKGASSNER